MKKNLGTADRWIRIVLALIILVLYLTGVISGTLALILGIVALLLFITALIGWCGLYTILGISTRKKE